MKTVLRIFTVMMSLVLLAGCSASPSGMKTVGLTQFAPHPSLDNCLEGFIEGMKQGGYEEGVKVTYDIQNAQADTALAAQIASTYAGKKVDLIAGIATPSAQAAFNEGSRANIPVVFSAVSDPVAAMLVNTLEAPGKSATGTSDILPVEPQLKLIRQLLPDAKNLGILYTTSETNSVTNVARYEALAAQYGFTIVAVGISDKADLPLAIDNILTQVDVMTNLTDNTVVTALATVLDKANAKGIPVFGSEEEQVANGCVGAMGVDYFALGVATGRMAAQVLDGKNPAEMPVQLFEDSKPFLNQAVLDTLGITVPEELAATATYLGE